MSEAEKKWDKEALKFAVECISDLVHPTNKIGAVSGYIVGIKDYKAALIREIDKMLIPYDTENLHPFHFGERDTLKKMRQLVNTVEP